MNYTGKSLPTQIHQTIRILQSVFSFYSSPSSAIFLLIYIALVVVLYKSIFSGKELSANFIDDLSCFFTLSLILHLVLFDINSSNSKERMAKQTKFSAQLVYFMYYMIIALLLYNFLISESKGIYFSKENVPIMQILLATLLIFDILKISLICSESFIEYVFRIESGEIESIKDMISDTSLGDDVVGEDIQLYSPEKDAISYAGSENIGLALSDENDEMQTDMPSCSLTPEHDRTSLASPIINLSPENASHKKLILRKTPSADDIYNISKLGSPPSSPLPSRTKQNFSSPTTSIAIQVNGPKENNEDISISVLSILSHDVSTLLDSPESVSRDEEYAPDEILSSSAVIQQQNCNSSADENSVGENSNSPFSVALSLLESLSWDVVVSEIEAPEEAPLSPVRSSEDIKDNIRYSLHNVLGSMESPEKHMSFPCHATPKQDSTSRRQSLDQVVGEAEHLRNVLSSQLSSPAERPSLVVIDSLLTVVNKLIPYILEKDSQQQSNCSSSPSALSSLQGRSHDSTPSPITIINDEFSAKPIEEGHDVLYDDPSMTGEDIAEAKTRIEEAGNTIASEEGVEGGSCEGRDAEDLAEEPNPESSLWEKISEFNEGLSHLEGILSSVEADLVPLRAGYAKEDSTDAHNDHDDSEGDAEQKEREEEGQERAAITEALFDEASMVDSLSSVATPEDRKLANRRNFIRQSLIDLHPSFTDSTAMGTERRRLSPGSRDIPSPGSRDFPSPGSRDFPSPGSRVFPSPSARSDSGQFSATRAKVDEDQSICSDSSNNHSRCSSPISVLTEPSIVSPIVRRTSLASPLLIRALVPQKDVHAREEDISKAKGAEEEPVESPEIAVSMEKPVASAPSDATGHSDSPKEERVDAAGSVTASLSLSATVPVTVHDDSEPCSQSPQKLPLDRVSESKPEVSTFSLLGISKGLSALAEMMHFDSHYTIDEEPEEEEGDNDNDKDNDEDEDENEGGLEDKERDQKVSREEREETVVNRGEGERLRQQIQQQKEQEQELVAAPRQRSRYNLNFNRLSKPPVSTVDNLTAPLSVSPSTIASHLDSGVIMIDFDAIGDILRLSSKDKVESFMISLLNCLILVTEKVIKHGHENFSLCLYMHDSNLLRKKRWFVLRKVDFDSMDAGTRDAEQRIRVSLPDQGIAAAEYYQVFVSDSPAAFFCASLDEQHIEEYSEELMKSLVLQMLSLSTTEYPAGFSSSHHWQKRNSATTSLADLKEQEELANIRLNAKEIVASMPGIDHIIMITLDQNWPFKTSDSVPGENVRRNGKNKLSGSPSTSASSLTTASSSSSSSSTSAFSSRTSSLYIEKRKWKEFRKKHSSVSFQFVAVSLVGS